MFLGKNQNMVSLLDEVNEFLNELKDYENIKIVGLMTMAPLTDDASYIKSIFHDLRHKKKKFNNSI